MRLADRQLGKRWSSVWDSLASYRFLLGTLEACPTKSNRQLGRPRLEVEELESRLVPSADWFTATPGVHVLNSPASSPPITTSSLPGGFSPQQISQAYGFNQITFSNGTIQGNGSGQTIAIVDAYNDPSIANDLAAFDSTYGIAAPPSFSVVNENGGSSLPTTSNQSWGVETSLDVEWAHGMAPGANIVLVEANSNSGSDLYTAVNTARNMAGVSVVSMSWGSGEWSGETSYDSYFTTPSGHQGVTFVASSGDSGSSGAPEYGSVSPNVMAVGGTQLSTDGSGNYLGETGWSGSGGGISSYETRPSYQPSTYYNGTSTATSNMRMVPDVAYNASSSSPYAVYDTSGYSGWLEVYGTSAGAPQWSSLVAIADQGRAIGGLGTLDGGTQTLPALYQLPASDFHAITSGSNGAYSCGPGYNLVTGLGSPLANQVVAGLVSYGGSGSNKGPWVVTPASATPSPVTGTSTNLSVLGNDSAGASTLTYTWSVLSEPSGAKTPTFSINASNAAQSTTATFYAAGSYTFQATITDASNLSTTSDVTFAVDQTLTSVALTPANSTVADGGTEQLTATAEDQFRNAMTTQPAFTWSLVSGSGTLSTGGTYTAPSTGTGTASVQATGGGLSATASITFGSVPAAPTNLTATVISTNQVNLAWTDNASNAAGVVVQRSTNGSSWSSLTTLSATATSYSDTSLSKNKTYYYRVYAENSFGNSPYSNTVTVTTTGGGGGGGGPGGKHGGQVAGRMNTLSSTGNGNWQQAGDMLWSDAPIVESLLSTVIVTLEHDGAFWQT